MKSTLFSLLTLATVLFFAVSCDNDLDVNAPFEETTIVYTTLDASTSVNYIRVTRAYLGDEGIYGGNNVADSLYYDSLDVQLVGRNQSGNIVQQITAIKDASITLDTGFFTTQGYTAYRINGNLNEDLIYEVVVTRPEDNAVIRAETQMVQDFEITQPRFPTVNPAGIRGQEVAWDQAVNGRVYNANMHLRYVEFPRNNKADSSRHTVTYSFPYVTGDNEEGIGEISSFITLDQFYGNVAAKLTPPAGNRIRIARRVDVEVVAGADDLATYINVSQPQSGVLQDPPLFTNVENGVGIVSSIRRSFELNKRLANASLDELVYGDYTCGLRFGKVTTSDTLFCQP